MACLMKSCPGNLAAVSAAVAAAAEQRQKQQGLLWRHSSCPATVGDVFNFSGRLDVPAQGILGRRQSCPSRICLNPIKCTELRPPSKCKSEVDRIQPAAPSPLSTSPRLDQFVALLAAMQLQMLFTFAIHAACLLYATSNPPNKCAALLEAQSSQDSMSECTVAGLDEIIDLLGLQAYANHIYRWCEHEGAVFLDEVAEYAEQLCDRIGLTVHQRRGMLAWAAEHFAATSIGTEKKGADESARQPRSSFTDADSQSRMPRRDNDCGAGTAEHYFMKMRGATSPLRQSCAAGTEWHSNSAAFGAACGRHVQWASPLISVIDIYEDDEDDDQLQFIQIPGAHADEDDDQLQFIQITGTDGGAVDGACDRPPSHRTFSEPMPLKRTQTYGWRSQLPCAISPLQRPVLSNEDAVDDEIWTMSGEEQEVEVSPSTQPEAVMMPRRW
eukprot:TRINITY_DN2450_c0_g1_i1.p1 TRINITY_DN2450_c0_g1~~TRINITY_DN2450_c0_g1_i1.p1  ORF type:complete len:441 (+),score=79.90 TRINITY_DN2450_c0_g1_i1:103-1425(+)